MATVADNEITRGLRGRVGNGFVFRVVRGITVVSRAPRKPDPLKQSAAQRQTRTSFKEAAAWAVRTLMDPVEKQRYAKLAKEQGLPNAYTAAVRDYLRSINTEKSATRSCCEPLPPLPVRVQNPACHVTHSSQRSLSTARKNKNWNGSYPSMVRPVSGTDSRHLGTGTFLPCICAKMERRKEKIRRPTYSEGQNRFQSVLNEIIRSRYRTPGVITVSATNFIAQFGY